MLTVALFIQWLHLCLSSIRRRAFCLHVITEDVDLMNFLELELLLIFFSCHSRENQSDRNETTSSGERDFLCIQWVYETIPTSKRRKSVA